MLDGLFTTPVYSLRRSRFVPSAFRNKKMSPKNRIEVYLVQTNLRANVCRNSTFQVLPRVTEPPFLSALHVTNDTTNPFGYKHGESTENNKPVLFFSGKGTIETFTAGLIRRSQVTGHRSQIIYVN